MASLVRALVICAALSVSCGRNRTNAGKAPWWKLNDDREIPAFGLGTWLGFNEKATPESHEVKDAVEWAIDAGYRHIDTASIYDTEGQVGAAVNSKIDAGTVRREDLFITTKLWNDAHARSAVVPTLKQSLQKLDLDYVDLYLVHWPVGQFANKTFDNTDYLETWEGMKEAKAFGLAKSIGVSNFNLRQLDRLINLTDVKPAVLQVEINLNLQQPELLEFCRKHGIVVMGYTPFGSLFPNKATPAAPEPRVDHPDLLNIAEKYGKTVPQIALKYLVDLGVIPIPKSVTKSRIEQNIDIFDFDLSKEDRQVLKTFDKNYHTILVEFWKESPYYPFDKQ